MWSSFAQRHQLETGTGVAVGHIAPAPSERPLTQQQHDSEKHQPASEGSSEDDEVNGGAWSDDEDILFEDEDGEYPEEEDNPVVQDDGGLTAAVAAAPPPGGDCQDEGINVEFEGGLGGLWERSAQSSFASASQRCASPPLVPSPSVEDGWDGGGGSEGDATLENSPLETQKDDSTVRDRLTSASPLDRVAERFGAALLASIDDDDADAVGVRQDGNDNGDGDGDDVEESGESRRDTTRRGFAGGFVLKGLSRFIEAATAPQDSEEEVSEFEEVNNGWSDDYDNLDLNSCECNTELFGDSTDNDTTDYMGNNEGGPRSMPKVVEVDRAGEEKVLMPKEHFAPTQREAGRFDGCGEKCADLDLLRENGVGAGAIVNEGDCSGRLGGSAKEGLISPMKEKLIDCDIQDDPPVADKIGTGEGSGWGNDTDVLNFSDEAVVGDDGINATSGAMDSDNDDKDLDAASGDVSIASSPGVGNTRELPDECLTEMMLTETAEMVPDGGDGWGALDISFLENEESAFNPGVGSKEAVAVAKDEKDLPTPTFTAVGEVDSRSKPELDNGAKTKMAMAAQAVIGVLEKGDEDGCNKGDDDIEFPQESDADDKSPSSAALLDDAKIEEMSLLVASCPIRVSGDKDDWLGDGNKIDLLDNNTPSSNERNAEMGMEGNAKDSQKEISTTEAATAVLNDAAAEVVNYLITSGEDAGVDGVWRNDDGLEFQDKDNIANEGLSAMGGREDGDGGQPTLCLPSSGENMPESRDHLIGVNAEVIDHKHSTHIDNELAGEGWDDVDISIKSPNHTPRHALSKEENARADSAGRSSNKSVSDSIRNFVAQTEMALDSEFDASLWKTPSPRMDPLGFDRDDTSSSSEGLDEPTGVKDQDKPVSVTAGMSGGDGGPPGVREENERSAAESEADMLVSKSLKELVDGLDAELNNFVHNAATTANREAAELTVEQVKPEEPKTLRPGPVPRLRHHCYEENKDDSPEPVAESLPSLPHQQSWYLNAMEGGKGGVVYGDEPVQSPYVNPSIQGFPLLDSKTKEAAMLMGTDVQCPSSSVGMPLSEMASKTNSPKPSDDDNAKGNDGKGYPDSVTPPKHSELQCRCLELIMPLPDNGAAKNGNIGPLQRRTPPGFGTKELPNGTTVLVNYEQLLQNEVTKRILLQRSVEAYKRRETSLSPGHASANAERGDLAALKLVYEQRDEIDSLRETVQRLQDEKDNMVTEAQLFEAELAASVNDKEYLERELEVLQQEVKQGEMARKDAEARLVVEVGERARTEAEVETMRVEFRSKEDYFESKRKEELEKKSRLIDQIQTLQSDLSEARVEQERLGGERYLLEQERDQLAGKVDELMELEPATVTPALIDQLEKFRSESSTLRVERDFLEQERDQLADRVEELVAAATKAAAVPPSSISNDEVKLLKGMIESLRGELDKREAEINKLSSQISEMSAPVEILSENHDLLHADQAQTTSSLLRLSDENESLRASGSQQGSQPSELKDEKISTWGKADELADEITTVTKEVDTQVQISEAKALTAENSILNERLVDLRRSFAQLEHQKLDLESNLEERANAIQSLEGQIKGLDIQVAESNEKLSRARVSLDEKTMECDESSLALQTLRAELDKAKAKLTSSGEAERHSVEVELRSFKSENSNLSNQLADLRSSHNCIERDLKKAMEERSSALRSNGEQVKKINMKETELADLRKELSCVRSSLQDKVQTCQDMTNSLEGLKVQLQESQNDREVIFAKSQEDADRAKEQTSMLQSHITELLSEHNATMRELEGQLTNSSQRSSSLHAQCEEYRLRLADSEKECTSISKSMSSTISEYTAQVSKLQEEKFELSTALKAVQSALELKKLEASGDSAKIKQLQRSVDDMQQEMESIAHRHQELLDRHHQEKAEMVHLLESKVNAAEQQATYLQLEREKLRDANTESEQTIKTLKEQICALNDANDQTGIKLFEASLETPDRADCLAENTALTKERDELRHEKCLLLRKIDKLASQVDAVGRSEVLTNGIFTSVEKEALVARVIMLEEKLKENNLDELRDELTSLHEERQQLDLDNEELLVQLGLMQQDKLENQVECEAELEDLRKQVLALQDKCDRLQDNVLKSKKGEKGEAVKNPNIEESDTPCETITQLSHENDSLKAQNSELRQNIKRFMDLEEKGASLSQTISELNEENCSLKDQVCDLTQNIEGLALQNSQIIKTLRQKLGLLELKLADKEEELESSKRELHSTLEVKDKEIFRLTSEFSSREDELKAVSKQLNAAKNEMGNINSQLESLKGQYQPGRNDCQSPVTVGGESHNEDYDEVSSLQDLLAEAVLDSDDDYLRHQIVVLAQALERSELQKADALERIFSERKSRSEGLRQLGESVKRFYISVRCSDAA